MAVGLALASATVSLTWGLLFYRPLPTVDGHYRMLGLHERAEVIRDVHGIPRIYARDLHDLFFLQGYVTAQDRLAQMEALRAAAPAAGGETAAPPAALRDALDAYADGVNTFVRQHAEARALDGDLVLAGRRPARWSASDSLTVASAFLGSPSRCVIAPASLSTKGHPIVAADVGFAGPPPGFYEIGLDGPDRRAVGVSLPGVPGLVAGHNAWVAWAVLGPPSARGDGAAILDAVLGWMSATRIDDAFVRPLALGALPACAADVRGVRAGRFTEVPDRRADAEAMRLLLGRPAAEVGARILVDLADVDTSRSAVSHGVSGQRASPHFSDQAALWAIGQVHRLPFTRGAIGRTDGELVLRAR